MIEDNPADASLIREALEQHAVTCELLLVTEGESATLFIESIEAGETPCPDLIILDLNLPRKPGLDILKLVRTTNNCNRLPLVILTSSDSQKDRDAVAALGASHYIQKPYRLDEFMKLGGLFKDMLRSHSN